MLECERVETVVLYFHVWNSRLQVSLLWRSVAHWKEALHSCGRYLDEPVPTWLGGYTAALGLLTSKYGQWYLLCWDTLSELDVLQGDVFLHTPILSTHVNIDTSSSGFFAVGSEWNVYRHKQTYSVQFRSPWVSNCAITIWLLVLLLSKVSSYLLIWHIRRFLD